MNRTLLILALVCILSVSAWGFTSKVGLAGAQFLKIGVGARYTALGEAGTAIANDASALYFNPAGIAATGNGDVTFNSVKWLADENLNNISLVLGSGSNFLGISAYLLSGPDMDVTTEAAPEGNGDKFSAYDVAFGVSYARQLTDRVNVGVTAKFISQTISDMSASGLAFDFGLTYQTTYQPLRLGMALTNWGPTMSYDGTSLNIEGHVQNEPASINKPELLQKRASDYPLPANLRLGGAWDFLDASYMLGTLTADLVSPTDGLEQGHFGLEFGFKHMIYLRGGYVWCNEQGFPMSWTAGAGVAIPMGSIKLRADYAIADFDSWTKTHRLSLGVNF